MLILQNQFCSFTSKSLLSHGSSTDEEADFLRGTSSYLTSVSVVWHHVCSNCIFKTFSPSRTYFLHRCSTSAQPRSRLLILETRMQKHTPLSASVGLRGNSLRLMGFNITEKLSWTSHISWLRKPTIVCTC